MPKTTARRRGRPPLGSVALTEAERTRRKVFRKERSQVAMACLACKALDALMRRDLDMAARIVGLEPQPGAYDDISEAFAGLKRIAPLHEATTYLARVLPALRRRAHTLMAVPAAADVVPERPQPAKGEPTVAMFNGAAGPKARSLGYSTKTCPTITTGTRMMVFISDGSDEDDFDDVADEV